MKYAEPTKDQLIKELRQSEESYRSIVESSPDGIITVDTKGFVTSFNTAFSKLTGYSKEEFVGRHFSKLPTLYKRDIPKYMKLFALMLMGKQIQSPLEFTWIHKDGTRRLGEYYHSVIRSHGKITGVQIVTRDITEKKKAVEDLERIFKMSAYMVCIADIDGYFRKISPAFCETLGYSEEELLKKPFLDFVHPGDVDITMAVIREKLEKGEKVIHFQNRYRCKDGSYKWIEWTSNPVVEEGITFGIGYDITDRKRAQESLIASEKKLNRMFESIADGILVIDPNGIITYANNMAAQIHNVTKEDLIGRNGFEFIAIDQHGMTREVMQKVLVSGRMGNGTEITITKPDGSRLPIEIRANVIRDDIGHILGFVSTMRDISERKQLEEERQKAAKLESVGVLAGGIAHDFNNLLTGITGNISLAKRNLERSELDKVSARLEDAERASMRSKDLTQQLLTFAKGGLPIKKLIDLKGLIKESTTFALRGSNIKPVFYIQGDLLTVEADEGQINQVLSNLIINANEAMPDGGIVEVGARNVSAEEMSTSLLPEGDYIEISVKDHGIGISKKHIDKIFDPYFSTKQKGSGLGLATAYSIVKNHGGDITVEPTRDVGTTFNIYLPASKKRLPVKKEAAAKTPLTGRGRILVMDDEYVIRQLLLQELSEVGHEVELSSDGAEAIKLYKQAQISERPFDAVILDLTVPGGMGGKQAIKELLEIDPEVKAIVSSGYATDPIMAEFKKYGFKGMVAKPYNITQLEETLHELLRKTK